MNDKPEKRSSRTVLVAILALVLVGGPIVGGLPAATASGSGTAGSVEPGATADTNVVTDPSFLVELREDGSARISLTLAYDLTSEEERQAFRTLQDDAEVRRNVRDRFRDRMASLAADTENATGRSMSVSDPSINLSTEDGGDTGLVVLRITWQGLAAVRDGGDRLVITEPFASGFDPERRFTVVVPDGYGIESFDPAPDDRTESRVSWAPETTLSGFRLVATRSTATTTGTTGSAATGTPTGTDGTGTTATGGEGGEPATTTGSNTGGQPGFGPLVALLAVVGWLLVRRRSG